MENLPEPKNPSTFRKINKPVFLFNALTGMQFILFIVIIPMFYALSLELGIIMTIAIAIIFKKVIEENKKGNYNYFKNRISFKRKYLVDKSGYLNYIVKNTEKWDQQ